MFHQKFFTNGDTRINLVDLNVTPEFVTDEAFAAHIQKAGRPDVIIQTLLKMFHHYNRNGFMGNPYAATYLLGSNPKSLKEYLLSKK